MTTVVAAVAGLGLPTVDADGAELYTGHRLRIGGAQGLSRAGIEAITTALLAWWGSAVVVGYIRDAPLSRTGLIAGQAVLGR